MIYTKDHGIPHSRQRWYCIGILNHLAKNKCINRNEFKFPEPRTCPSIGTIVGSKVSDRSKTFSELGKIAQQNVLDAEENIFMGGFIPESAISVVDIDSSAKRCKAMSDVSPCLTRSRYNGHWLTQLQRRMTVEEMLLLQGMDPGKMKGSCSRQNLGKMVGNSMSVNVLERVLSRALNATDLVLRPLKDRWDNEKTQMKPTSVIEQPQPSSHKQCHAFDGERRLIVDSGASFHMVDSGSLTPKEKKTIRSCTPIPLQTANGIVYADKSAKIYIRALSLTVDALMLKDSPPVLSLGRLCTENGLSYIWTCNKVPYLIRADGTGPRIECIPKFNVPFITTVTGDATTQIEPEPQCDATQLDTQIDTQSDTEATPREKDPPTRKEKAKQEREKEAAAKRNRKREKYKKSSQTEHNVFTHYPKDPNCDVCRSCKTTRAHCRSHASRVKENGAPEPVKFADAITADTAILNEDNSSRDHDMVANIIQDKATQWLQAYPAESKSAENCKIAFQRFVGPGIEAKNTYTDNSKELAKALKDLGWPQDTSTSHRPETNGQVERAVRRVKEGTSCTLYQSGWKDVWWSFAMYCYCFLRNVVDVLKSGKPHGNRDLARRLQVLSYHSELRLHITQPQTRIFHDVINWVQKCCAEFFWVTNSARVDTGAGTWSSRTLSKCRMLKMKGKYIQRI